MPRIAALVLAAGRSRRMGETNKLLIDLGGQPMIERIVNEVGKAAVAEVVVVTGHQAEAVELALARHPVRLVRNPRYREGLSSSLRHGLQALQPCAAVVVCLGDMPGIRHEHIDRLIQSFDPRRGRAICVPVCHGQRGNPVLWARSFFSAMRQLTGDRGARALLSVHADQVHEVVIDDLGILNDIDTREALRRWRAAHAQEATVVSSRPPHSAQEPS